MTFALNLTVALLLLVAPSVAYLWWGRAWKRTAQAAANRRPPEEPFLLGSYELDQDAMREASAAVDAAPLIPTRPGYRDASYKALELLYALPAYDREGDTS